MKRLPFVILAAIVAPLTASAVINQPVSVSGGMLSGTPGKDSSITVFKGVPFAAPPIGALRWRAPQPVVPWRGVRDASKFGDSCVQDIVKERKPWTYEFMTHTAISEDCLYLNVWTPAGSSSAKLPVYFYLSGGGNTEGSGAVPVYDGEGLARKGIIVVTINYRVGIFGFFAHPELTAEAPYHASGNYAELDLIAALKWVKQNIAQFGGDPNRVTIGGQSAGSGHVHTMVASPLAKGLFRGAINESGTSLSAEQMPTLAEMEQRGVAFAKARDIGSVADLRQMSWRAIVDSLPAGTPENPAANAIPFNDCLDGYVYTASVLDTIAQGKQNDVPTIAGGNRDEGGVTPNMQMNADAFFSLVKRRYAEMSDEFLELYPAGTPEEAGAAISQAGWDQSRTALFLWTAGRAKTAKTKVFTYFWEHPMPGPDVDLYGAFHTSEVPYVMNSLSMSDRPFTADDSKIADILSSYWANFIKTGDPNGPDLPHWPSVNDDPWTVMEVGDNFGSIPVASNKARQDFMEKYLTSTPRQPLRP